MLIVAEGSFFLKTSNQTYFCGFCLGPLHGIPYGLKDIIAVPHYKTTWGSRSFKNQVLDIEAWVYKRYLTIILAHVNKI